MSKKEIILYLLKTLEINGIQYMVTRNFSNLEALKDVDLIVRKLDIGKIENSFRDSLCKLHIEYRDLFYKELPGVIRIGYVFPQKYFIKIDLIYKFEFWGVTLLDSEQIVEKKRSNNDGFMIPTPAVEFLIIFMKEMIKGKAIRIQHKYKSILKRLLERNYVDIEKELCNIFNPILAKNILNKLDYALHLKCDESNRLLNEIRKSAFRYLLKSRSKAHPLQFIKEAVNYYYRIIKFKIKKSGIVITFYGPDGVGKSSVIQEIFEDPEIPFFSDKKVFHFRPSLFPYLSEFVLKKKNIIKSGNPYLRKPYSKFVSLLKITYYILDYTLGFLFIIRPLLAREYLIIFDRYYIDQIVDAERIRLNINKTFLFKIYKYIIPKPDINICLFGSPEIIISRKADLTEERINNLNILYRNYLREEKIVEYLDTSHTRISEITSKVKNIIEKFIISHERKNHLYSIPE